MKTEENITPDVKELLDALAEPRANQQRQQQLSKLIDRLAEKEQTTISHSYRKSQLWRWVGVAAAAACVVLFIIWMPNNDATIAMPEAVASTEVQTPDSMVVEEVVVTPPTAPAKQITHHKPILLAQAQTPEIVEELETIVVEKQFETIGTIEEEVTPAPNDIQTNPTPVQPTRRVVACNNLVCYDCKTKHDRKQHNRASDKTILGTPISPNMDEGMLMLASL